MGGKVEERMGLEGKYWEMNPMKTYILIWVDFDEFPFFLSLSFWEKKKEMRNSERIPSPEYERKGRRNLCPMKEGGSLSKIF